MCLKLIQYNFNASAKTYLKHAQIQKISALKIINKLPEHYGGGYILDLGSGPGTMYHSQGGASPVILYDLSIKQLRAGLTDSGSKNTWGKMFAVNGDASSLPFAAESITTVISNLMLQWPKEKLTILKEIRRILRADGVFMFTTLLAESLWQLKAAWGKLDNFVHTLDFLSDGEYVDLLNRSGFQIIYSENWENTINFTDIHSLMYHFKLTGTTLPKSNISNGLGGRKFFKELEVAYSKDKRTNTLPLSYQYLFIIAKYYE